MNRRTPDPAVSPELLLGQADFVRALARRLLADPGAADDVAQEALVRGLEQPPRALSALRAWLARVTRNLAAQRARAEARRARREREAARAEALPSTAEVLARESVRAAVVRAVLALAEPYRTTLLLRYFEGLPPRAIARRLGVPVETVRTREKRALAELRARLDGEHGARASWAALLLPLARVPLAPLPLASASLTVLAMPTALKLALGASALLVAGLFLWNRREAGALAPSDPDVAPAAAVSERAAPAPAAAPLTAPADERAPLSVAAKGGAAEAALEAASTGSLRVRVLYHDGTPAPDVPARVEPDEETSYHSLRGRLTRTDEHGEFRVADLDPGRVLLVLSDDQMETAEVRAGEETTHELTLSRGFDVAGVVLDPFGHPVAGAEIFANLMYTCDGLVVAHSGSDGRFRIRSCSGKALGARAAGFAPSLIQLVRAAEGAEVALELVLLGPGGEVTGTVQDELGQPVADAFVLVGDRMPAMRHVSVTPVGGTTALRGSPAKAIEARTDEQGRYRIAGLAPGLQPVAVRAAGFAIARGDVDVVEHQSRTFDVVLAPGVDLVGLVSDSAGEPVRARVSAGDEIGLLETSTLCAADGTFRLDDLEPGAFVAFAEGERGRARAELVGVAGEELVWEPVLAPGSVLRGRVLDGSGAPLAGWGVSVEDEPWVEAEPDYGSALTDAEGRFLLEGLHERAHRVEAFAPESFFASAGASDVWPEREELVLHVDPSLLPSAHLRGSVLGPDGRALAGARLTPTRAGAFNSPVAGTAADGSFALGPYPPGTWWLHVEAAELPDCPGLHLGPRELGPGETWECGAIQLLPGGALEVSAPAPPGSTLRLHVLGLDSRGRLELADGLWRLAALAPGRYELALRGAGVAAALVPFEIRSNETTRLTLTPALGLASVVEVRGAGLDARQPPRLVIRDAAGVRCVDQELWPEGGRFRCELALAPGTYAVECRGPQGTRAEAPLTVAPGVEPLVLELR